jgi:hypothetical protein
LLCHILNIAVDQRLFWSDVHRWSDKSKSTHKNVYYHIIASKKMFPPNMLFKGGIATDSVDNLYSLQCIINVFLDIRQNAHVIWPVKREMQSSNALLCKQGRLTYIATCNQCVLDTLLNLPFKGAAPRRFGEY